MNNRSTRVELGSQFYSKNHCAFFTAIIASILTGTTSLIVSRIIKEFVDMLPGQNTYTLKDMIYICLGFIIFTLILAVMNYLSEPAFIRRAMIQYKDKAFSFLSGKNIASFRDENSSTYLSALTNDATAIENSYISQITQIISKTVAFVGALCLMLYSSPLLTAFVLAVMIFPTLISVFMGKRLEKAQRAVSERNTLFTSAVTDCLGGFQVIKSFRAEKEAYDLFSDENNKLEDAKFNMRRTAVVTGSLGVISGAAAQLGVFIAGSYLALSGKGITPGSVIMFINLMNLLIQPISELPRLLAGKKAAGGLIDKLASCLDKNNDTTGCTPVERLGEGICFKDISFSYDEDKEVLHDINCTFMPGRSYAIVGGSGSGKSTLLNMLMTGTDNYNGSITIDGKELSDLSNDSLYDLITPIQQNVFIFNASIKDNVTMFRDFPEEQVADALRRAHLEELIAERGEDYLCGENGKGLSGGEKQRISIARSLLKGSPVLLADEITSALDSKTSHEVINEILEQDSMTRIVVTHSLEESVLRRYDEILVIKDGTIKEKGNFDTLIANDGYFNALFKVAA